LLPKGSYFTSPTYNITRKCSETTSSATNTHTHTVKYLCRYYSEVIRALPISLMSAIKQLNEKNYFIVPIIWAYFRPS